jgi:hypothetical protein
MAKQTAPAFAFAPDEIVEALETSAGSGNLLVKQGTWLRASHELVHRWPEKWIKDGASDDEKVQARHRLRPEPEPTQHVPLATAAKPLLDEDAVICVRSLHGVAGGDSHIGRPLALPVGARLSKDAKIVKANPSHFVAIVSAGRLPHFEWADGGDLRGGQPLFPPDGTRGCISEVRGCRARLGPANNCAVVSIRRGPASSFCSPAGRVFGNR